MKTLTVLAFVATISISAPAAAQYVPSPAIQSSPIQQTPTTIHVPSLPVPQVNVSYPPATPSYGCCWEPPQTWEAGNAPVVSVESPWVNHYSNMQSEPYVPVPLQMSPLPNDWIIPQPEMPTHSPYWK